MASTSKPPRSIPRHYGTRYEAQRQQVAMRSRCTTIAVSKLKSRRRWHLNHQ